VRFEPRAYAASALTLRSLLQELPGRYRTALLIAHNPGLSQLAASLAGSPAGDDGAGLRFPTAAVAVFSFTAAWPALLPGLTRLTDFTTPADLSLPWIVTALIGAVAIHGNAAARLCGAGV
jgi:phosphohistidine phosphatase